MPGLVNYYVENGNVITTNDLNQHQPMDTKECIKAHYYLAPAPMGHYFDLGAAPVGQRPQWKSYEVGRMSCVSPTKYRDAGWYDCRQPCWCNRCK